MYQSHVTHMNESCHTNDSVTHMNESCHTYLSVTDEMSHVPYMNTHECIMSHTPIDVSRRIYESRRTFELTHDAHTQNELTHDAHTQDCSMSRHEMGDLVKFLKSQLHSDFVQCM